MVGILIDYFFTEFYDMEKKEIPEIVTELPEKIFSLQDLEKFIGQILEMTSLGMREEMAFYRGQSSDTYELLSGIARYKLTEGKMIEVEKTLLLELDSQGQKLIYLQEHPNLKKHPFANDWFKLFQGQHLGLRTRLMDWTDDAQVALLFAVENEKYHLTDGQLWIFMCNTEHRVNSDGEESLLELSPFETDSYKLINFPYYIDNDYADKDIPPERRRARQHGKFLVQSTKDTLIPMEHNPLYNGRLFKIIVDADSKKKIKEELNEIGLTIEWAYFRTDENMDNEITEINNKFLK